MSLTDTQFHQYADDIFHIIENAIEQAIDEQDADIDIDATGGVLQITFEDNSKIVINKQEPLHQIWLATKFGGYHFVYEQGQWIDSRTNMGEFLAFVQSSITKQSGLTIAFS